MRVKSEVMRVGESDERAPLCFPLLSAYDKVIGKAGGLWVGGGCTGFTGAAAHNIRTHV